MKDSERQQLRVIRSQLTDATTSISDTLLALQESIDIMLDSDDVERRKQRAQMLNEQDDCKGCRDISIDELDRMIAEDAEDEEERAEPDNVIKFPGPP